MWFKQYSLSIEPQSKGMLITELFKRFFGKKSERPLSYCLPTNLSDKLCFATKKTIICHISIVPTKGVQIYNRTQ